MINKLFLDLILDRILI